MLLAGAAVLTAGAAAYFGADFVLAKMPATIAPPAAQALNMLALYLVLPLSAGGLVFAAATGVAIARWASLPRWLGWAVILIGISLASPALILGVVALALWTATVSILVWRRAARALRPTPSRLARATPPSAPSDVDGHHVLRTRKARNSGPFYEELLGLDSNQQPSG